MFSAKDEKGLMGLANRLVNAVERKIEKEATTPSTPSQSGERAHGSDYVPMTVETFDNHVYFYANVDTDRCLDLLKRLRQIDNELRTQKLSRMLPEDHPSVPIWLHIQSQGGELFTGFNVADQLSSIKTPIYSIVEGLCASAATLISMSCDKRYIMPSSFMLIHQISLWRFGAKTYEEMKDEMHLLDKAMNKLYEFYQEKSKIGVEEIQELLKRDTWFDANETILMGLADEIFNG